MSNPSSDNPEKARSSKDSRCSKSQWKEGKGCGSILAIFLCLRSLFCSRALRPSYCDKYNVHTLYHTADKRLTLSPLINYVSYVRTIQGSIDDLHVDYLPLTKGLHQWYHGQSESLALFEKFPDLVGRVVVGGGRLPQFAREGEHVLVLHEDSGGAEIGR